MSGATPPGVCGEVLRHNQANQIDASALFYSDVENMDALAERVQQMRARTTPAPGPPDAICGTSAPVPPERPGTSPPGPDHGR
jgi:hypothetical protein